MARTNQPSGTPHDAVSTGHSPRRTIMAPFRARQRTSDVLLGLHLLAMMLIVGPSCGPASQTGDWPSEKPGQQTEVMSTDVRAVVEGGNQLAVDLYARLRAGQAGNLFFAPESLSASLAMVYAGARGETADQMAEVLHFRLVPEKLHPAFGELRRTWGVTGNDRGYRLNLANRLWSQEGLDFLPGLLAVTREQYGAQLAQVDFARQTEQAVARINSWVEERTQGKIRDLMPPGVLDAKTRLVLTNAIYFKGDWTVPFRETQTQVAPFHVSAGQQTDVPLMFCMGDVRYWAGEGLKVLELPYGKGDLAMLILLPDKIEGLSTLEAKLTTDSLSRWQSGIRTQEVRVHLPRFRVSSQFQLAGVLKAMGMTRAFTPGEADLSGVSSDQSLFLSAVVHKAFVEVNEQGTAAAAVTGIESIKAAAPIAEPPVFRADHPFIFLIRDNRTESILFLGRFVNPQG